MPPAMGLLYNTFREKESMGGLTVSAPHGAAIHTLGAELVAAAEFVMG